MALLAAGSGIPYRCSMPDRKQIYFDRLMLPGEIPSVAHKAALQRAHDLRRFEIENYWKRSSYFWGFQLVAFGALALVAKDGRFHPPIVLIVAVVGAVSALTGILSARGSKFWQQNWEHHVDLLEVAAEGRLHGTALTKRTPSYSVSRVNERFLETIFAGWVIVFVAAAAVLIAPGLLILDWRCARWLQISIPTLALLAGMLHLLCGQRSELGDRLHLVDTMMPVDTLAAECRLCRCWGRLTSRNSYRSNGQMP